MVGNSGYIAQRVKQFLKEKNTVIFPGMERFIKEKNEGLSCK